MHLYLQYFTHHPPTPPQPLHSVSSLVSTPLSSLPPPSPPLSFLAGKVAPKELVIMWDHNEFKCQHPGCGKSFRKQSLLISHMKHYHSLPMPPQARGKRGKPGACIYSVHVHVYATASMFIVCRYTCTCKARQGKWKHSRQTANF